MKKIDYLSHFFSATVDFIFQRKYLFLVCYLIFRYAIYSTNGLWTGDFWEHSAVVRELTARPLNPLHPQLLLDSKHAFFTPYAFLVVALGWLLRVDSITALALCGALNLALLSYGLTLFIKSIDPVQSYSTSFYSMILILMFWGSDPWHFSGFYSFEAINSVLPYPSTFALGLSLLGLTIHSSQLISYSLRNQILLILICTIVLITHSLTAIFLLSGIVCQTLTLSKLNKNILFRLVLLIVVIFCLVLFWPYFSMLKLMTGEGDVYHFANTPMYLNVIERIWPTILFAPIIILQLLQKKNWAIGLTLMSLLLIYIFGYLSNKYSYGRSIAFILLLTNILLAQRIVEIECYLKKNLIVWLTFKTIVVFVLLLCTIFWVKQNASRILTIGNSVYLGRTISDQITYKDLLFISSYITEKDQILANVEASWIIPSLGGKVVATDHPLAFVPDWYTRKWLVMEFFNSETSSKRRLEIFHKYQPNLLLINKSNILNWNSILNQFTTEMKGLIIFDNEKYILLKFN